MPGPGRRTPGTATIPCWNVRGRATAPPSRRCWSSITAISSGLPSAGWGMKSDAEDVTQSVCMRLPDAIRSFDGRAAFTSWLYRVTLNAVRDLQRSRQRQARLADAVATLARTATPRRHQGDDALHVADIWRAVRALPEKAA